MHSEDKSKIESYIYAYREGNTAAFDTLYLMYQPMVEAALVQYARGNEDHEGRSLANEAFHNAVVHWSADGSASFGTYAKRCVINALKKLSLSRKKENSISDVDVDRLCTYVGVESRMIRREAVARIRDGVRPILSEEEYRVFLCCVLGSMSVTEYASSAAKTRKQVENTKSRVIAKLKRMPELFSVLEP